MDLKYFPTTIYYCFFIFSCASIKAPPGGPKDETPPKLIEVIPPIGSVNFSGGRVELIFSEYLKESSVLNSVSILPKFEYEPEIIFKGEKIIIDFPKNLLGNQTYIISISRKLLDEHGVSFSKGIQAALSTGPKIDKGSISGLIYGQQLRSVLLWKVDESKDSISYFLDKPNYVIDVSDEGLYNFNYLSNGVYRVVALNENSIGIPMDSKYALVGLPWHEYFKIDKNNLNIKDVNIIIPKKSGQNKMLRAEWLFSTWIKIHFLNNLDKKIYNNSIKFFNNGIEIYPKRIFEDRLDNSVLHIILGDTITDIKSMIIKTERFVESENTLLDSGQVLVNLDVQIDSTNLKIESPDKGYILNIQNDSIMPLYIDFSKIINQEKSLPFVELIKDSLLIPINLVWDSPLTLAISPKNNWHQNEKYKVNIMAHSIAPFYGNTFADSVSSINFRTSKFIRFGKIIGQVRSEYSKNLILKLKNIDKNKSKDYYTSIGKDGGFSFELVPEGNYRMKIFYDNDNNFRYSFGDININKPAEWFLYYPDTIKVRGNWDLELTDIELTGLIK
tara:strand:+ start:809 stop:2482 length:1674 start_codon:yes stop_codon:yes gene_type:complete